MDRTNGEVTGQEIGRHPLKEGVGMTRASYHIWRKLQGGKVYQGQNFFSGGGCAVVARQGDAA